MKTHWGNFQANLNFILENKLISKSDSILEIGSGSGALLHELSKRGYRVEGLEVNQDYIDHAKSKYNINLRKVDNHLLPLKNNTHTKVISFDVLEHIPSTSGHLSEVKRVLKSKGSYIFSTPNKLSNVPYEMIQTRSINKYKTYHPSVFSYWGLKKILLLHNFCYQFYSVDVVTEYFYKKINKSFGKPGVLLTTIFNPDKFPIPLKTNFYVKADLGGK